MNSKVYQGIWIGFLSGVLWLGSATESLAMPVEVSGSFSYDESRYSETDFTWTRRWSASVSLQVTTFTGIEFEFQRATRRAFVQNYQDTVFEDTVMSVNWVQALGPQTWPIQPYFKLGVGQLNREASGSYAGGYSPAAIYDSLTGVTGAGMKIYLTRRFSIKAEATSYLAGGNIQTWRNNIAAMIGCSWVF